MLNKNLRIFKNNVEISGYILLADFFLPQDAFFKEICSLSDNEKLIKIYENISGESVSKENKNRILNVHNLFEVICLDDDIYNVDLTVNNSLSYSSVIVDNSTFYREICSYIALYYLVYKALFDDYLDQTESVDFVLPFDNKTACVSALIFKKFVSNLNFVIAGDEKVNFIDKKSFYKPPYDTNEARTYLNEFLEDYGIIFDSYSSSEVFAYEDYLCNYDTNANTIFFSFMSPYLTSSKTFKQLSGKVLQANLANKKIYEETAQEIPSNLENLENNLVGFKSNLTNDDFLKILDNLI